MLVIPFVSDQPVNARQIEKMGLGKVLDYKTITAEKLKKSALDLMKDIQIRNNLAKIQEEIAQAPGNIGAVKIIEVYMGIHSQLPCDASQDNPKKDCAYTGKS